MKKGRRYIETMTGRGDKDIKKRDIIVNQNTRNNGAGAADTEML